MIRFILSLTIFPGKEPTKENILKRALKNYLLGYGHGLCFYMLESISYYIDIPEYKYSIIQKYIPEFNEENAIEYFDGLDELFWWPIMDWKSRYKFMKWLIRKHKRKYYHGKIFDSKIYI